MDNLPCVKADENIGRPNGSRRRHRPLELLVVTALFLAACQDTGLLTVVKGEGTVATPTFNPSPTTSAFNADQSVSISTSTDGATIYYTVTSGTQGTAPTTSSTVYSTPIPIQGDGTVTTIEAMATKSGMTTSAVATATYSISYPRYTLTVQSDGHGGVTPNGPQTVVSGAATSISCTPGTGYGFTYWSQTSGSGTATFANANAASTTVTLTGGNATIQANFSNVQFQLTPVAGLGGNITDPWTSPVQVYQGAATPITAVPLTGYTFVSWTVSSGNGVVFSSTGTATSTAATDTVRLTTGDASIRANFGLQLTVTAGTGGSISAPATSPITVIAGQPTTITASPGTGYSFVSWTVSNGCGVVFTSTGTATSTTATDTVKLTTGDASIRANFGLQLTVTAGTGGSISAPATSPTTVIAAQPTTITASPDTGYSFVSWTVSSGSGVVFTSTGTATSTTATDTVKLTTGDASIRANFGLQLTVSAGTGGSISAPATSPTTVIAGQPTTITASPSTSYSFGGWSVALGSGVTFGSTGGNTGTLSMDTVTLTTGNATVLAFFTGQIGAGTIITQPPFYTVTVNGPTTLHYGTQVNFTSSYTGTAAAYAWYLDTSLTPIGTATSLSITPTISTYTFGAHVLTLMVTDANGLSYSSSLTISVQN
jgi:hypothetical protein